VPPPVLTGVQVTVMFPVPSLDAKKDPAAHDSVSATAGYGTANPADATAAASTRLKVLFTYMVYLEAGWQVRHHGAKQCPRL
jgi:hypothetical protein